MTALLSRAGTACALALAAVAALALSPAASAGGRVVSSAMLAVEGEIGAGDGTVLMLNGRVHVVSQVLQTDEGPWCGFNVNLAGLEGEGSDGSAWVGVGAVQWPPNPCYPPNPIFPPNPVFPPDLFTFTLMPVTTTRPDTPATVPFTIEFNLVFDLNGRLISEESEATLPDRRIDN